MNKIDKAKSLLVHYFELAGCVENSDNVAEIESIIDLIVEEITEKVEEVMKEVLEELTEGAIVIKLPKKGDIK